MDLRQRLRMLKAAGASRPRVDTNALPESSAHTAAGDATGTTAPPSAAAPLQPSTAASAPEPGAPQPAMAGALHGFVTATPAGNAFYLETEYPVEYCRGPLPLEHVGQVAPHAWQLLGRVQGFHPLRAVYLDTETTGLGGMGTYLFLIGLGFFRDHTFVVRQYFMRDYPDEPAILEAVYRDISGFDAIVSFNGRTFDWPLLEGRLLMHRLRPPLGGAPHLDLLHPARRLWRERIGSCSLTNLEEQILGLQRLGDVPGDQIPGLYFEYLRTGNVAPLAPVFLHNRVDIVSLVSLAGWMGHMVTRPLDPTPDGQLVCGDDLYALSRLFEARGALPDALLCLEAALQRGLHTVGQARALRSLSQAYKRLRQHERAVQIWEQMVAAEPNLAIFPLVELAKYYEHVAKAPGQALGYARQALEGALRRRSLGNVYGPALAREIGEIQHRINRLERKAAR